MEQVATLVDSNVLIDVFGDDSQWRAWSISALERCSAEGSVAINPIVYAEVAPGFASMEELDDLLSPFDRLPLSWEAGFAAARAFMVYRQQRGGPRTSILPDFYIGAHAAVSNLRLLTRDATRFRTYFPTITIIAP